MSYPGTDPTYWETRDDVDLATALAVLDDYHKQTDTDDTTE